MLATLLSQYLFFTYSTTSSLLVSSKSVSISGIDILAGFRNLSKSRSYSKGSRSIIPTKYDKILQAADHLQGPTAIS